MKELLLSGFLLSLLMLSVATGARAQQSYGDPVGSQDVPTPLKLVAVDERPAPAGWKRIQFGEPILFSVLLPGPPEEHAARVSGSDGGMVVRAFYSTSGTAIYGVTHAVDLPGAVAAKTEEQQLMAFKNFIYGFAAGVKQSRPENENAEFKITAERATRVSGLNGYEKDFTLGPLRGRAQMVFQDKSRVTLICLWGDGAPTGERASFFNSFKLSPQR